MLLHLTDLSSEPLQGQIIRQIRAKILAGELKEDKQLPSIRVFAKDNLVSAITVRRAYENLERAGLIHSKIGKGFFVAGISNDLKKKMAKERLIEIINPAVKTAFEEGLTEEDIKNIFHNSTNNSDK
jgi:GntR family transcriptional regulator